MYELFNYNLRMLEDYFPDYKREWDDDGETWIIVNGKRYLSQFNLSDKVDDTQCRRVRINRKFYYFS